MLYNELTDILKTEFADVYVDDDKWPKAYCGSGNIRAIVLGADPSNPSKKRFEYAFGLEDQNSPYFSLIKGNLNVLGLRLDEVYVQNVCRNYFTGTTFDLPRKTWLKAASHWVSYLKQELDSQFGLEIPILVTTEIIFEALAPDIHSKRTPSVGYYRDCTFIEAEQNRLGRKLIPLFRHYRYKLENWEGYADIVRNQL